MEKNKWPEKFHKHFWLLLHLVSCLSANPIHTLVLSHLIPLQHSTWIFPPKYSIPRNLHRTLWEWCRELAHSRLQWCWQRFSTPQTGVWQRPRQVQGKRLKLSWFCRNCRWVKVQTPLYTGRVVWKSSGQLKRINEAWLKWRKGIMQGNNFHNQKEQICTKFVTL